MLWLCEETRELWENAGGTDEQLERMEDSIRELVVDSPFDFSAFRPLCRSMSWEEIEQWDELGYENIDALLPLGALALWLLDHKLSDVGLFPDKLTRFERFKVLMIVMRDDIGQLEEQMETVGLGIEGELALTEAEFAEIDKALREHDLPSELKPRFDHFKSTGDFLLEGIDEWTEEDKQNIRLVHGFVTAPVGEEAGKRFASAWIEHNGQCHWAIDIQNRTGKVTPIEDMYAYLQIDESELTRYTVEAALMSMAENEDYGPWEARFMEYNPILVR